MAKSQKSRSGRAVPGRPSPTAAPLDQAAHLEARRPRVNPPRKRPVLLATSVVLFVLWFIVLTYLALA